MWTESNSHWCWSLRKVILPEKPYFYLQVYACLLFHYWLSHPVSDFSGGRDLVSQLSTGTQQALNTGGMNRKPTGHIPDWTTGLGTERGRGDKELTAVFLPY